VAEQRSAAERLLDLVVFGPAGLVVTAAEEFPRLAEKGRHRVEGQLRTARLVGQIAMQMARRQVSQVAEGWVAKAATSSVAKGPSRPSRAAPVPTAVHVVPDEAVVEPGPMAHNGQGVERLAIPGYDSLSASQVVQRLTGLSHGELMDVRAHEQSHRHRRTILSRVEQLLADGDGR
jgi:hypothetical protein